MASPIEESLLRALLDGVPCDTSLKFDGVEYATQAGPSRWLILERDVKILTYRADFMVTVVGLPDYRLVVECDGHDFHDRTKHQAAYDRARDRELMRHCALSIRFTGSEIHHSPERCASEVFGCLEFLHHIDGNLSRASRNAVDDGVALAQSWLEQTAPNQEEH